MAYFCIIRELHTLQIAQTQPSINCSRQSCLRWCTMSTTMVSNPTDEECTRAMGHALGLEESSPTRCSAGGGIDHEKTVCTFLTGRRLRRTLAHLCNHASVNITDPISNVVHMMLTCPVQMVVSEVGKLHATRFFIASLAWSIVGGIGSWHSTMAFQ
jgi:hypothetical protein